MTVHPSYRADAVRPAAGPQAAAPAYAARRRRLPGGGDAPALSETINEPASVGTQAQSQILDADPEAGPGGYST